MIELKKYTSDEYIISAIIKQNDYGRLSVHYYDDDSGNKLDIITFVNNMEQAEEKAKLFINGGITN